MPTGKPEEMDRRAVTAAAFEAHEQADQGGDEPAAIADAAEAQGADAGGEAAADALAGDAAQADAGQDTEGSPGSDRDEKGRFKPKAGAKAEQKPDEQQAAADGEQPAQEQEKPAAPPAGADLKPPSSWKPAAREKWTTLDPDVKAEIARVDREVRKTMQEAATTKKQIEAVDQTIAPFAPMIAQAQAARGEQYNPLPVVGSLLRTAAVLQVGSISEKAQLVASLIKTRGIPLDAINEALGFRAGQPAEGEVDQGDGQPPAEFRDPRVDQLTTQVSTLLGTLQKNQQAIEQQATQKAQAEHEAFEGNPANVYADNEEIRNDMADLIDLAAKRGKHLPLQEAYERAVAAHPEFRKTLEQQKKVEQVKKQVQAIARAKAAASSVPSSPVGARPDAAPTDRRGVIAQAFAEHENGRI